MKRIVTLLTGLISLVALDQLVKLWTLKVLKPGGPIPIIPGVLELSYVENRGAAFGILQNRQWLFIAITVLVVLGIILLVPRIPRERHYLGLRLCAYFILAGAAGNMIDRIIRGYVVDMIYFRLIDFPVFNVADIYVTCSAFALIFLMIFFYKDEDLEKIFPGKKE